MGKPNIAHHTSYHPYRRDNIERVRRDEEEAAKQEADKESRMALADAEARLTLLREHIGLRSEGNGRGKQSKAMRVPPPVRREQASTSLFEDLEQVSVDKHNHSRACDSCTGQQVDYVGGLALSAKGLNLWYTDKSRDYANVGSKDDNVND
ncbi:hypothetical protein V8B97DRAFT_1920313 [Scleroderma yunnanense]